jgi:hypothetical protein
LTVACGSRAKAHPKPISATACGSLATADSEDCSKFCGAMEGNDARSSDFAVHKGDEQLNATFSFRTPAVVLAALALEQHKHPRVPKKLMHGSLATSACVKLFKYVSGLQLFP